jgi:hypothetical protein
MVRNGPDVGRVRIGGYTHRLRPRSFVTVRLFVATSLCALLLSSLGILSGRPSEGSTVSLASASSVSSSSPQSPLTDDPLGPLENVTANWGFYQPATDFCITPDVYELPGFTPSPCSADVSGTSTSGTYDVKISTPPLCAGCVRLFIDYSKIVPDTGALRYSHGHAYFRLSSLNPTYTSDPVGHSPNVKNLTNDYLVAPPGSLSSAITAQVDPHLLAYAADTAKFAHTDAQGPYYVGPGYYNTAGDFIDGTYVDIDLNGAKELGSALDPITYQAGFDSDPKTCPDSELGGPAYADGNYFYAGCVNWMGSSTLGGVNPWPNGD